MMGNLCSTYLSAALITIGGKHENSGTVEGGTPRHQNRLACLPAITLLPFARARHDFIQICCYGAETNSYAVRSQGFVHSSRRNKLDPGVTRHLQ